MYKILENMILNAKKVLAKINILKFIYENYEILETISTFHFPK